MIAGESNKLTQNPGTAGGSNESPHGTNRAGGSDDRKCSTDRPEISEASGTVKFVDELTPGDEADEDDDIFFVDDAAVVIDHLPALVLPASKTFEKIFASQ